MRTGLIAASGITAGLCVATEVKERRRAATARAQPQKVSCGLGFDPVDFKNYTEWYLLAENERCDMSNAEYDACLEYYWYRMEQVYEESERRRKL